MAGINPSDIRRSIIAGSWYPGNSKQLQNAIRGFLEKVQPQDLQGELLGLVAPHAGYAYSGQVAAYAYAQLRGRTFSRVIVVAPMHRVYPGRFAVSTYSYYETPLGLVPVDGELVHAIEQNTQLNRITQDMEHSLEIQLPFLQSTLGEFMLTPIMMGEQDWNSAHELGQALAAALRAILQAHPQERILLVASTDLSHFHPYREAVRLDQIVQERISAFDPRGLMEALLTQKAEACGGGPVGAVMLATQEMGANRAVVLKYMNSGDVMGDQSGVVGYVAAALLRA